MALLNNAVFVQGTVTDLDRLERLFTFCGSMSVFEIISIRLHVHFFP